MLLDLYALALRRDVPLIVWFLECFLPFRKRGDENYTVHHDRTQPDIVLSTPEEAIAYCSEHPNTDLSMYWMNTLKDDPHSAHLHFLEDGGLVLGLSVKNYDDSVEAPVAWHPMLDELMRFSRSEYGYCTGECPPERTSEEFRRLSVSYREAV
jgi:hypothetical protein